MYRLIRVRDRIRVPPEKISEEPKLAVEQSVAERYDAQLDPKLGLILCCVGVEEVGEGKIFPNDPGVHYDSTFELLVFKPELHQLVEGEVIDNVEFGAFVRIGPLDGLVHISQLLEDFVSYDSKNSVFLGRETKKVLKEGDLVRARVISVSLAEKNKVGLTMRQPGLGSLNWLEEEKRRKK